jgi:hypothetical protein
MTQETAEIINFPGYTRHNISPKQLMKSLVEVDVPLDMVTVVAMDEEGQLFVATSRPHDGDTLMLLKRAEQAVMEKYIAYEDP